MEINLSCDQLNAEYSMLMSVLGASVSKHLIDAHYTCIWANDDDYDLIRYPRYQNPWILLFLAGRFKNIYADSGK